MRVLLEASVKKPGLSLSPKTYVADEQGVWRALGQVTSLSGARDDTRFLQMSTPVQPGNSGGALLDMSGSVVGVVVAQLSGLPKSVPQNVNFAIQPSMVINFWK